MAPQIDYTAHPERPALLTVDQAGRELGCGRSHVYTLMAAGELRSVKIGRNRRIPAAEIGRYIDSLLEGQGGAA